MKAYLNEFQVYLHDIKKSSDNTLESYMRDIRQFASYCDTQKLRAVSSVKPPLINDYILYLQNAGKSTATLTRIIASLRCYFAFLNSIEVTSADPIKDIKIEREKKKLPEVLTAKEVSTLLAQPNAKDLKGCRDKAMLELLYATGIKVSELISIELHDLNLSVGVLHLHNGKTDRFIPLYPDAVKSLTNYCNNVRDIIALNSDTTCLFTNMSGEPMTRQGLWKIIKYYADKANIKKDITPHTIRHSFATHLLENGAPLKDIQEILGHQDLSSTQIYAQLMRNRYAQSYKKYHPLAR